jgi:xylan 1,4-beta-xylosidase
MGSPIAPNFEQYRALEAVSELTALDAAADTTPVKAGHARLAFQLPRQGVSLILLGAQSDP